MCFQNFMKNICDEKCDEKCRIVRTFSLSYFLPHPPTKKKKVHSQSSDCKYSCIPELLSLCELHLLSGSLVLPLLVLCIEIWGFGYPTQAHTSHECACICRQVSQVMGRLEGEVRQWAFPHPLTPGTTASPVNADRSLPQSFGSCCLGFCCHHEIACGLGSERTEKCK